MKFNIPFKQLLKNKSIVTHTYKRTSFHGKERAGVSLSFHVGPHGLTLQVPPSDFRGLRACGYCFAASEA